MAEVNGAAVALMLTGLLVIVGAMAFAYVADTYPTSYWVVNESVDVSGCAAYPCLTSLAHSPVWTSSYNSSLTVRGQTYTGEIYNCSTNLVTCNRVTLDAGNNVTIVESTGQVMTGNATLKPKLLVTYVVVNDLSTGSTSYYTTATDNASAGFQLASVAVIMIAVVVILSYVFMLNRE